jgi:hypothetical protein
VNKNGSNQLQRIFLNVVEVSYALNVCVAQVRKWDECGMLPSSKLPHDSGIGSINRKLWYLEDVEQFAQRFRTKANEPKQQITNESKLASVK